MKCKICAVGLGVTGEGLALETERNGFPAVRIGFPVLATSSTLACFDSYRSEFLSANLTQAHCEKFEARTFRRKDSIGAFHTERMRRIEAARAK